MIRWQPRRPVTPLDHQRRWQRGLVTGAALAALIVSTVLDPRPWLVYNPSPSVPVGFYWISALETPERGDLVLVTLPLAIRQLADQRHYIPATVPVLKRVAALGGDEVCAFETTIRINGKRAGERRQRDRFGRPMPWWTGCHRLQADEVFLFNAAATASFDGRYFGMVKQAAIVGRARPL